MMNMEGDEPSANSQVCISRFPACSIFLNIKFYCYFLPLCIYFSAVLCYFFVFSKICRLPNGALLTAISLASMQFMWHNAHWKFIESQLRPKFKSGKLSHRSAGIDGQWHIKITYFEKSFSIFIALIKGNSSPSIQLRLIVTEVDVTVIKTNPADFPFSTMSRFSLNTAFIIGIEPYMPRNSSYWSNRTNSWC